MPGPRDNDHLLRDGTSDLTATESAQAFTVTGGIHSVNPISLLVLVPKASASDTLKVAVKCTTTGKKIEVTHTDVIDDNSTFPYELELPLPQSVGEAWTFDLTLTGSSIDFGAVQVWLERTRTAKVDA